MSTCKPHFNNQATSNADGLTALLPTHLADLRASGLSDRTIDLCRFRSVCSGAEIAKLLHWKSAAHSIAPALAIPFLGPDGEPTGYVRLKPSKPRTKEGKVVKYESPVGSSNRAYFPPGFADKFAALSNPVIVSEGEKKAACADQHGFCCIGLVGVYGWQQKREKDQDGRAIGERQLIDDLDALDWNGRIVCVCYDSDAVEKKEVLWGEWHLAQALQTKGANVKVVRLPAGPPGADNKPTKIGLDDFLVAHGVVELADRIAAACPASPPEYERPLEAIDDPFVIARNYLNNRGSHRDGLTIRRYAAQFQRWDGVAYRVLPDDEIRGSVAAHAKEYLDAVYLRIRNTQAKQAAEAKEHGTEEKETKAPTVPKVTRSKIADVLQALESLTTLSTSRSAPFWIASDGPFPADQILACQNGLIHLPSFAAGKGNYQTRATPRFFSSNALPYHFNPAAPRATAWLDFLNRVWPNDPGAIAALQEWFGYSLLPDTRQHKILMIVGPKRSGKGTIARVLRALVGVDNTAAPTLASLGTNFGLSGLVNKTLAVISDARLSSRTDVAVVTERLLSISGEDGVDVDRKFLPPLTAHRLLARFLILTNELPRLNDPSGALVSRLIILRQTESWLDREDHALTEKLQAELPSILLWAIEGYKRLLERGHFVQPESAQRIVEQLEELSSPIGAFLRERCKIGPECEEFARDLFAEWQRWSEAVGRKDAGTEATFGRDLRAALPGLDVRQRRVGNERPRKYIGLRIRVAGLDDPEGGDEA